jgi:hypothetical protein
MSDPRHAVLRWGVPLSPRLTREAAALVAPRERDPETLRVPVDQPPTPPPLDRMDPDQDCDTEIAWFLEEHQFAAERL